MYYSPVAWNRTRWPPLSIYLFIYLFNVLGLIINCAKFQQILITTSYLNLCLLASLFGHPSQVCGRTFTFPNLRWLSTPLATTCVYLQWLAMSCVHFSDTLIELKFARKWTQVFHRLATQRKSTQVCLSIVFLCTGARAKLHWNDFLATCVELVCTCESVWPPITSLCSQVHIF